MEVAVLDRQVVKTAESEDERKRLGREARILRAVAHPGVVRLEAAEGPRPDAPDRLVLRRIIGTPVRLLDPQPARAVAGWAAALATIVADLHDLGYAHGDLTDENVVIDNRGRPVLCGFGRARRLVLCDQPARSVDSDVDALARIIGDRLPPNEEQLRRMVLRWEAGGRRCRSGARGLATALVRRIPDACLGPSTDDSLSDGSAAPIDSPARRRRPTAGRTKKAVAAVVVLAVAGVAGAAGVALATSAGPKGSGTSGGAIPAYVLKAAPGEEPVVVVARWGCGPPRPAVADARSGAVWLYPTWPAQGADVTGQLLARVPGADGVAAVATRSGCEALLVLRRDGSEVSVAVQGRG